MTSGGSNFHDFRENQLTKCRADNRPILLSYYYYDYY